MPRGEDLPPPLHPQALSKVYSLDSGDFRRYVVIDPARILCVAGYFCCIGIGPMHFPATFLVATVSVVLLPVCPTNEISARRFWWCGFLSLCGQIKEDEERRDSGTYVSRCTESQIALSLYRGVCSKN